MRATILPARRDSTDPRPGRLFAKLLIDAGVNVPIGADENYLAMEACAQLLTHLRKPTKAKGVSNV